MTTPFVPTEQEKLYDRLTEALGSHDVTPEDRDAVLTSYFEAGGTTIGWDDLPKETQDLVTKIEAMPTEAWDDPADLPDQQNL